MFFNVCVHTPRKAVQNTIGLRVDLMLPLRYSLSGAEQPLQVVSVPAVIVRNELQISFTQSFEPDDLRPAALSVSILEHHFFQMVLGLCIPVSKERCLPCFTHNMRNAVCVSVDRDLGCQRVF